MRRSRSSRSGFALAAALLALVCMGALLVAAVFTSRTDHVLVVARRASQRALAAAEFAAWSALAGFDTGAMSMARGDMSMVPLPPVPADSAVATLTRLGDRLFLAVGEAGVSGPGGVPLWRRVAVFGHVREDSVGDLLLEPLPQRAWVELP